jgi:hypothetical protein
VLLGPQKRPFFDPFLDPLKPPKIALFSGVIS